MTKPQQHAVLILYNLPLERKNLENPSACAESEYGVLQEVSAVASALANLSIPFRIAGARNLSDLPHILHTAPEPLVFNLVEGFRQHPAAACLVPAICETFGKACTGNDTACHLLALDKWRTNAVLRAAKLATPPGVLVPVGEAVPESALPRGPLIVKPALADASEGIDANSVVPEAGPALHNAVTRIHEEFEQPALVEAFVGRRELNISLIQRGRHVDVLGIAEIDFSALGDKHPPIVDYAAKWISDSFEYQHTPRILPAPLAPALNRKVARIALSAWQILRCQDYVRVDFRLDDDEEPVILEVNPNPDISPESGFAAALQHAEIAYVDFVRFMLQNARKRLPAPFRRIHYQGVPSAIPEGLAIRRAQPSDRGVILTFLKRSGFFRPNELDIAREVLEASIAKGESGHYQSYVAAEKGVPAGWVCLGRTPGTLGTFDLYWIAVNPRRQGRGLGRFLMQHAEDIVRRHNGRILVIETSSRPVYDDTNKFYLRVGFRETARLKDFYAPGDDKVIYMKTLVGQTEEGDEA